MPPNRRAMTEEAAINLLLKFFPWMNLKQIDAVKKAQQEAARGEFLERPRKSLLCQREATLGPKLIALSRLERRRAILAVLTHEHSSVLSRSAKKIGTSIDELLDECEHDYTRLTNKILEQPDALG